MKDPERSENGWETESSFRLTHWLSLLNADLTVLISEHLPATIWHREQAVSPWEFTPPQFTIHDPGVGLYRPVLELAAEEVDRSGRQVVKVAGLVGATDQAVGEAGIASDLGYDCGLLSLGALKDASDEELIEHSQQAAEVIPLFGFYLQPAIGGRELSYRFWRRFLEIENVVAVKIAPFNRYQTLDVVRAVADSGRAADIGLYTGNDDSIILDLLTPYRIFRRPGTTSASDCGRVARAMGSLDETRRTTA